MANTPIYGFETPDDTDLVKDGALSIRTALGDVDTTLGTALNSKDYAGLVLVKKQTIGTGVASVQVTDAFSADYDAYKILVIGGAASGTNYGKFILGATTSQYYVGGPAVTYAGANSGVAANNVADARYTWYLNTGWLDCALEIKNPFAAKPTGFSFQYVSGSAAFVGAGVQGSNTSFTSFTLSSFGAETLTGGTIYVYGYGAS